MSELTFGQNNEWTLQNDYVATCVTNARVFSNGELYIPDGLQDFFGADAREKRIVFLFEGREYPSYLESEGGDGSYKLSWSKALNSKFIGLFPDYANFFENVNEYNAGETPIVYFEKMEETEFLLKLILPSDVALTLKQSLFDFLGPGKSVAAFADSYEMVFLRYYMEQVDNRWRSDVFMVSAQVQKFYMARINAGKDQDQNAEAVIENIATAGLDDVLSFLMEHPYMTYAEKGLMAMETVDEHFYFTVESALIDELSTDDRRLIIEMLDQKIEYYFERLDGPGLQENLTTLMNEYASFFTKDFRYSFKDVLTEAIPACLGGLRILPGKRYKTVGFAGDEEWALVPWVSILDKEVTRFPGTGVYISYLLNKDTQKLYLALCQGYKEIETQVRKNGLENDATVRVAVEGALEPLVDEIKTIVRPGSFASDNSEVDLPDDAHRASVIFFREYQYTVPGNAILEEDLKEMLAVYNEYYERVILKVPYEIEEVDEETEGVEAEFEADEILDNTEDDETEDEAWSEEEVGVETEDDEDEIEGDSVLESGDSDGDEDAKAALDMAMTMAESLTEESPETKTGDQKTKKKHPGKKVTAGGDGGASLNAATLKALQQIIVSTQKETVSSLNKRDRTEKRSEEVAAKAADLPGTLRRMTEYIVSGGFSCEVDLVQNLYLSLKSTPFVLLTGGSGVGKSQFVRLFAEAMGANTDNERYLQIPVRSDWKDSRELLGYLDANGHYIPGSMVDFIADAVDNPELPFFLCLDEMGVAPLEGYFGEILSILETRRERENRIITDSLLGNALFGRDEEARKYYGDLYLPGNLMLVGTVTNAEARSGLSRKVLDRAGQIEIRPVGLKLQTLPAAAPQAMPLGSDFLRSEVLVLERCTHHREMVQEVVTLLEAINGILAGADAGIGYRVRDQICFYLLYNAEYGLMTQENALDHALLQNILPRIMGGGAAVESVMTDLFKICAGTRAENAVRNYPGGGLFPKSAEKLSQMVMGFDRDGIASFWK